MSYRKLKADYLFDGFRLLDSHNVLICRADGTVESIMEEEESGSAIQQIAAYLNRPGA
jgi:hypothetical protein